jgi:hypothetical protein
MTLAAQLVADVSAVFLNTSDFAEAITYTPYVNGVAQTPKSITAVVDRGDNVHMVVGMDGQEAPERVTLFISTDGTAGVANPAYGDRVTLDSVEYAVNEIRERKQSGAHLLGAERVKYRNRATDYWTER